MLERNGIETGYSLENLIRQSNWLKQKMGNELPAMVSRAGGFPVTNKDAA